jgi:uncharacterized secreted protein with C-terminal beta-propeller domain
MTSWQNAGEPAIPVHSSYLQPGQNERIIGVIRQESAELKIEKLPKNSFTCAGKGNA